MVTKFLHLFLGVDSVFDSEWMTSKIDLTCLPEHLDSNFNLVNSENEIQPSATSTMAQSPSIVTALLADKLDKIDPVAVCTDESTTKDANLPPNSPEQHVPDVNPISEVLSRLYESIFPASETTTQEYSHLQDPSVNDVVIVESVAGSKMSLKRKLSVPLPESPKAKVRTPEQKQRKRLQNRNAATRYRSKKRSEQEILNAQCLELEEENVKLRDKIGSKQQEIQYLKDLIIDVFSKKPNKS
jgi:hypothetical protein